MRRSTKLSRAALLMTSALLFPLGTAQAQDAQAPDARADDKASPVGDIVVTARKTNESITDVPVSITALTADALQARDVKDMSDVASFTPGLRNQNQSVGRNDRGYKQYIIRGVVPGSASSSRQSVTLFVDGAPVPGGNFEGVSNIDRIEVVKGPQSAFFGRATFAGAINLVTRPPAYDWGGDLDVSYASFNTYDAKASVEGPIIDDVLAFRLGGHIYHTDGAYKDVNYPGERLGERGTKSISGSLRFDPTPDLHFRAFGVYWEDDDGLPANGRYNQSTWNCNGGAAPAGSLNYTCGKLTGYPKDTVTWIQDLNPTAYAALQGGQTSFGPGFIDHLGLHREAAQARLSMDWDIGEWNVSALGSYDVNKWNFLQTLFGADTRDIPSIGAANLPYAYNLIQGGPRDESYYGEVRVSTPKSRPIWATIGANYLNQDYDVITTSYTGAGYGIVTPRLLNNTETIGLFGSVNWDITDSLTFSGEARYQWDKQYQKTFAGTNPTFENTFRSFTPRAILQYEVAPGSMVYGSFSVGNRPGEFNSSYYSQSPYVQAQIDQQASVTGTVPEDKLYMYEVGYKGWLIDHKLRVLASAYYGQWKNRHIPSTILYYANEAAQASGVLSQIQVTAPSGKVDLSGVELELLYIPHPDWTVEGTFSYARTDIKRTYSADALAITGNGSPVGTQLPYYPEKSGSLGISWEHAYTEHLSPFVRMDAIYTDRIYATEANLAYIPQNVKVNLRVGAKLDKIRLEAFATNLFDNRTPSSLARVGYNEYGATGTSRSVSGIVVSLADPRTVGVRASIDF
ncbi:MULTISPECIES: TonB-dependent receptor [unclassified Novosphingobium]|uniref:TonB-dependent receptor n=1 Tax=unclassified Novosphingobium TaxID=2644732 RepID=UPI001358A5DD|nr:MULTISPECIES: TonB-dependent receptor [unclassified Novosphingobium]